MKSLARKVGAALLAAVTSPEVVKQEKKTAVLVIVRVALALGASAGTVALIEKVAGAI